MDAANDLRFNLAHVEDRGLLSISLARAVGVDIEAVRPIEVLDIARHFFSPHEIHVDYVTVGSAELNLMAEDAIRRYRLLIFPGGDFVRMGNSLTPRTSANLRNAVLNGVNYLGVCAGAFLAGSFPKPYNSLNLTSGVQFGFYAAARDTHKTNVPVTVAGGPTLDQYWEDGPQFTGWGGVVARYPDGTPAVVEGTSGNGWVILTGVHPEAPESWRRGMMFRTPASTDNAYAATLIQAALNRTPLSHF